YAVAISGYTWKKMIRSNPIPKSRTGIIYYGLERPSNIPARGSVRKELGISESDTAVIQVSRIEEGKGIREIWEAAQMLWKKDPKVSFFIAGAPTTEAGRHFLEGLQEEIREKAGENKFLFLGHRKDVFGLLAGMDIAVLYSRQEAFGLGLLEASLAGLPCIGSDNAGMREILKEGRTGFLIPPLRPELFAERILELSANAALRKRMGEEGKERTLRLFSFERHVGKTLRLYRKLTEKKILLVQLRRIGDVINTLPAAEALKKKMPCKIHFLTEKESAPLLENHPHIDKVVIYRKGSSFKNILSIRRERYDFLFDFLNNPRSQILTLLSDARMKIGFRRGYSSVYDRNVPQQSSPEYVVRSKFRLLEDMGIEYNGELPRIYLLKDEKEKASRFLGNGKWFGAAPYSRRVTRRWSEKKFAVVIRRLLEKYRDLHCMIFLAPGEREYAEKIKDFLTGEKRFSICPPAPVREIAALIGEMKMMLCCDNGLKHIALALEVPALTLHFANDPVSWNPPSSKKHVYLQSPAECRECEKKECPDLICRDELSEEEVFEKAEKLLSESSG
ncbi:MAG TPA: glycosyltransferase, partial [bacterium]|nr:glycosyltransferase [bacterium]